MGTERSWEMWALQGWRSASDYEFHAPSPSRQFTEAYLQPAKQEVVRVLVREDPDGPYFGWLPSGKDTPIMIYGHRIEFYMCFPYGPEAEEQKGKGKVLKLAIDKVP